MKKIILDAVGVSTGGNITVLNNILYYFTHIDKSIKIVLFIGEGTTKKYFLYNNEKISVKIIYDDSILKRIYWQQFKLHKIATEENADVILSVMNIVSFFPQKPQVVYFHQSLLFVPLIDLIKYIGWKNTLKILIQKVFVVLGFLKANKIIVQTNVVKNSIINEYPSLAPKIEVIHSGLPKHFLSEKSNWCVPENIDEYFKILYISHPSEYKNFDFLFNAASVAKNSGVVFKFLLTIDNQSDNKRYKSFINQYRSTIKNLAVDDYFEFIGSLKNNVDVQKAYQFADAVIHPSLMESFPQTFTEAMEQGKPLISINLPYAKEICGDDSIYFDKNNPDDLVDKIHILKDNPTMLADMSQKSKKRSQLFSPEEQWGKLLKLINSVIESNKEKK